MTAATADPRTVRELKAASVQRVLGRRKTPEWRTVPGSYGDVRICTTDAGELRPAATLSEWVDDRISQTPPGNPVGETMIIIMEAGRGGPRTAAAAVAAAGKLRDWDQFFLWSSLASLNSSLTDVDPVLTAIRLEWRRLKLQATVPTTPMIIEKTRPKFTTAFPDGYSPGVPEYMKVKR